MLSVETLEHVQGLVVDGLMDKPSHCGVLRKDLVTICNPHRIDEVFLSRQT